MIWLVSVPGSLFAQGNAPLLFNKSDVTIHDWAAKQPSEINYSPIQLNNDLLERIERGEIQQVSIPGPDDQLFIADLQRILHFKNGGWSAIGTIDKNRMNTISLSYSPDEGKLLSSVNVISDHSYFNLRYDPNQNRHLLIEKDPHESDELACAHDDPFTIQFENRQTYKKQTDPVPSEDHAPSTIDVMIVYTPQAENWANANSSGIINIMNQAMATAELSMNNSELDIRFQLVHNQLIQYAESGDSRTDLYRLTASPSFNNWGEENAGFMDEVHQIRDEYGADLVALFTFTNDVGGIAWVINSIAGAPRFAFSITRIQQASGPTLIHELGHNFGNVHSRNQEQNPAGSNGGLFPYSTGWRWIGNDGLEYASVMTYPEGAIGVPYISNPNVLYQGVPTGSYDGEFAPADNARSMRQMQHAIEEYRTSVIEVNPPTVSTNAISDISFSRARVGGNVSFDGGVDVSERGICWSTDMNPGFSDMCQGIESGTGLFEVLLTNLNQGTQYYVRAFASNPAGASFGNQQTFTTRTLEKPATLSPTNINAISFTARWSGVLDAETYFLDISTASNFSTFVSGYENVDVGNLTSLSVTDLMPGTGYYYRVRSGAETVQSENSNVSQASTVDISMENSEVTVSRNRVLATGVQESIIMVTVQNSSGNPVEGAEVVVGPDLGSSTVSPSQATTDNDGMAMFSITNSTEETVHYDVIAAGLNLSEAIEVEFLFSEGELTLGNNYPNPYNNQTVIPIVVPQQTRVRLDVYNSAGAIIQTVLDEEYNIGYYEIPFNASGLASGVYFYRMVTDQGVRVEKMLLMK